MEDRVARGVSYVFHPLLVPFYILLLLLHSDSNINGVIPLTSKLVLAGVMFFITILVPVTIIAFLFKIKMISSFYLEKQEERIYPLLIIGVFYYLAYYLMKGIRLSPVFSIYLL